MKGINFFLTLPFLTSSVGCSEYQAGPQKHYVHSSLQVSSYINHDVVVDYLCGEVGVYRCLHRTPKHSIYSSGPGEVINIKSDNALKTSDDIYYFSSGSSYLKSKHILPVHRAADIVDIEASTDSKGSYYYNARLAEKRIKSAIKLIGLNGQENTFSKVLHVKCCFGKPGVLPPLWRDRYVMIKFKPKT